MQNDKGKFLPCKEVQIPTSQIEEFLLDERLFFALPRR